MSKSEADTSKKSWGEHNYLWRTLQWIQAGQINPITLDESDKAFAL